MKYRELEQKIASANLAYAKGLPFLTDTQYDILWKKLYKLNPNNAILYHTAKNPNFPSDLLMHKKQLYGTNKAFNMLDLKPFITRFGDEELILEPKYDGCAAILNLGKNSKENTLVLEGDGIKGHDITHHLSKLSYTFKPQNTESVEVIISKANWKDSYGKNPRNTISGWLNRKVFPDVPAELVSHNNGELSAKYTFTNYDEFAVILLSNYNKWSKIYPMDGIMIKVADEQRRLIAGNNGQTYSWSVAWKPPMQVKETTVTKIEWNVSRLGRVIPTVIYEPIELCKTTNTRASGNNAKWIHDKQLRLGSVIDVGKAGEIIPTILRVKNPPQNAQNTAKMPEKTFLNTTIPVNEKPPLKRPLRLCPICESELFWEGVNLICNDPKCIAQLCKSLSYFYSDKGMEVKSVGESMIEKLLYHPKLYLVLTKSPWALLDPMTYDIYSDILSVWGKTKTETYMTNVQKLRKNPAHFIASLGLPGLAYKTALKLFHYIKSGQVKGSISAKARNNFVSAFVKYTKVKEEFQNFTFLPLPPAPKFLYCITGTLSISRNDMIDYLTQYAWEYSNQISKHVDILISGDNPGRTKTIKAKECQVLIINEKSLTERIKIG